jgi:hypothetical protein
MNCIYCLKELNSKGLSHQLYCKGNPNRKDRVGTNNPNYGNLGKSNSNKCRKYTTEQKERKSVEMKKAVKDHPESYSASKVNGRCKKSEYKGFKMDSSWELEFAKWCDSQNIKWIKPKNGFEYEWNGIRTYFPDFYLSELNVYIEVKGYQRDRDLAKWKSLDNLIVIKSVEIKKIKEGTFKLDF